jgi:hypothetical protein
VFQLCELDGVDQDSGGAAVCEEVCEVCVRGSGWGGGHGGGFWEALFYLILCDFIKYNTLLVSFLDSVSEELYYGN